MEGFGEKKEEKKRLVTVLNPVKFSECLMW